MLLPTSEAGKSTLQVLDFNVRSAFNDDDEDDADADPIRCQATLEPVTYPTRIVMPNIFVDVVESGLPYREARRDVRGDYSGVMIDDERLVGLKVRFFLWMSNDRFATLTFGAWRMFVVSLGHSIRRF